jgi:type IV pilus assembly protein PilC
VANQNVNPGPPPALNQNGSGPAAPAPANPPQAPAPVAAIAQPKAKRGLFSMFKKSKEDTSIQAVDPNGLPIIPKKFQTKRVGASPLAALNYIGIGKERIGFVQNLATLLNAGLTLMDSLKTLQLETRVKPMKKLIQRLRSSVESGTPLWKAMDDQHFFSPYVIALVRIGEEAGSLARNMEYLAVQQEKDQSLKSKVKMAMIYPSIVMVLVVVVVVGLGGFVLPNLIPVLHSLGGELPLTTRIVIATSNFFTEQGAIAIPSVTGGFALLVFLHIFTKFRIVTQWVIFKIPGIGRLAREATIARFGVILGGLLQAGVPLVDSINSLAEVTSIEAYKSFYFQLRDSISLGLTFQKSFKRIKSSTRLLPVSVQQLVVVGEQSGSLSAVLLKIADVYDRKASETAQKLPVILEPMLLLFMGGLVGIIAFAIITPIYNVVGSVGR